MWPLPPTGLAAPSVAAVSQTHGLECSRLTGAEKWVGDVGSHAWRLMQLSQYYC